MGFIQQDSNSVILDLVITDLGKQMIAKNDGSFSIVKYAFGDDEVDYSIIQQFGRTIGKEKIEKNTPIFEALTNQNYAQKYRLVSVSNPDLYRLPTLSLVGEGVDSANKVVSIGNTTIKKRTITVYQTITNETSIDVELRDQTFIVELSNMFLELSGYNYDNIDGNRRATYLIPKDVNETSLGGSKLTITLAVKALSESQFTIYGSKYNKNLISTFVKVSGVQSGTVYEFETQISKTT